ncbi:MAG TPA: protein translocase subunit SecD [Caulobacteraceae bacterium]|jgi:preprotein translocase subunit SecD
MLHIGRWKLALVALAVVFGVLFSVPNLFPKGQTPGWLPARQMNLGLDLQGGSYLLLEVDTRGLRRERVQNLLEDVRRTLREEKIAFTGAAATPNGASVRIGNPAQVEAAARVLGGLAVQLPAGGADMTVQRLPDQRLALVLSEAGLRAQEEQAIEQSIEVIRRRLDETGTKEITPVRQGRNRIVVTAPGEDDPERLKRLIGQTARLTFQMVDDTVTPEEAAAGRVPPGSAMFEGAEGNSPELLKRRVEFSGENLVDARLGFNEQNQPIVSFRLDSKGSRRFASITTNNVNKRFAIVLDDKVISAPVINEPITGGQAQISGNFTQETANELAVLLRAGALPAPLNVEEQRTVGAELGQDAIEAGKISTALAFVAVLGFMVLAYGLLFGGISIVALVVNGLLIIAALSLTGAALSLPGIAGLILTLAVAVDANVLIYERMREEVRAGRTPMAAADAGFSRAMVTILDANITTLVAALIMFQFGSGPVRGFAWTLSIGVFTSVFTAVYITQILLAWWFKAARPKKLPIS